MVDPLDNLSSSEQLRRLLLQEEQERIDRLEARLGSDGALKESLVPIIADVLRDAGVKDYRRLAGALAPIVLQSIKTEIHNSRDMMVDALYPITGRLVAAAVRNAFKDLVEQLNERLDSSLSVDRWRAKIKAGFSGRSEAEILISEGAAFDIVDLLLINRQSGLLIAQAGPDADHEGTNSHLLSSILTAIMAFVRDAMNQSSEQDLRTLHVGDMRLHLQVSPTAILAIKTKGPPPSGFDTALSETFYAFLSRWGNVLSDPDNIEGRDERALTEDLEERFQSLLKAKRSNFKGRSNKAAIVLGSLALAAVLWIGWTVYERWSVNRFETKARLVIAEQPELKGYPIDVGYLHADDTLRITGLLPDDKAIEELREGMTAALPNIPLSLDVSRLPDPVLDPETVTTKMDLAELQQVIRSELVGAIDERVSSLATEVRGLESRFPTSAETDYAAFRIWLDRQSLRFGERNTFFDEKESITLLETIAERFSKQTVDVGLRVVGYSDDLGDEDVSDRVSQSRALVVAGELRRFGVPPDRLQVVGRGKERRINDSDGPGSANRRVEFELVHRSDEATPDGLRQSTDDGTR